MVPLIPLATAFNTPVSGGSGGKPGVCGTLDITTRLKLPPAPSACLIAVSRLASRLGQFSDDDVLSHARDFSSSTLPPGVTSLTFTGVLSGGNAKTKRLTLSSKE